jgi:outer membrane protein assembly factor BamB
MKRLILFLGSVLLAATAASQPPGRFDWPQWQGPDRNAISREGGLLQDWPRGGPTLAWKATALGGGDSTPSIAAGRIFGMSIRGPDEVVWALSETNGQPLWVARLGPAVAQDWAQAREGPGCTPTVDGERLYVIGMAGDLSCVQVSDGKILWQRSLSREFGAPTLAWSFRESPLVDGNKVICTPGGEGATLVALDKLTGATIWKSPVNGDPRPAYASAIAFDFEGQRQYVAFTARSLVGIAASNGKPLWWYTRVANGGGINCATPIYHDGHVFAASAYGAGGALLKLRKNASGDTDAEGVWLSKKMQNQHGGVILFDGFLYGAHGGNEGGALACLEFATGKVQWDERDHPEHGVAKGSVALADGRLYYRAERGTMLLVEPSPKQYIERGRFDQPDRSSSPAWAHPVIANGKLYVRDHNVLLCYNVKADGEPEHVRNL